MERVEFAQWAWGGVSSFFGRSGRSFCTANQENRPTRKRKSSVGLLEVCFVVSLLNGSINVLIVKDL